MCFHNIHRQGYLFIGACFLLACAGFSFSFGIGVIFLVATALVLYFFRDPVRVTPVDDKLVVSPADGVITSITKTESPIASGETVTCISIFLGVLDVHVNRVPVSGTVKLVEHHAGKFSPAYSSCSIGENEKVRSVITSSFGSHDIVVEQVAGVLARRIVCTLNVGDDAKLGSRMGIIKFGSRMNVYIPSTAAVLVTEGLTVVAGETIMADLEGGEYSRYSSRIAQ